MKNKKDTVKTIILKTMYGDIVVRGEGKGDVNWIDHNIDVLKHTIDFEGEEDFTIGLRSVIENGELLSVFTKEYNLHRRVMAAIDGMTSLILSQYSCGVDISSKKYLESVDTTLEAIFNEYS